MRRLWMLVCLLAVFVLAGCAARQVYSIKDVVPGTGTVSVSFHVESDFYDGVPDKPKVFPVCIKADGAVYEKRTQGYMWVVPTGLGCRYACPLAEGHDAWRTDWRKLWAKVLAETEKDLAPIIVNDWKACPAGAKRYEAYFRWVFVHGNLGKKEVYDWGSPFFLCNDSERVCYLGTNVKNHGELPVYGKIYEVGKASKIAKMALRAMFVDALYVRYFILADLGLPVEPRLQTFIKESEGRYKDKFVWDWLLCKIAPACPGDPYKEHHGVPFEKGNFWYGAKKLVLKRDKRTGEIYLFEEGGKRKPAFTPPKTAQDGGSN